MKKYEKKQNGFTLVEVIVVLVILAIIAAVAIPALTNYIDMTNKNSCLVVRSSLARGVTASYRLNPNITAEELAEELEENYGVTYDTATKKITGVCPTDGGYTITIDDQDGTFNIACSKHGGYSSGTAVILNNRDALFSGKALKTIHDYFKPTSASGRFKTLDAGNGNKPYTLDSTGKNFGKPIKDELQKVLALDEGQNFEFRIVPISDKNLYTIYIFDDVSGYTAAQVDQAVTSGTPLSVSATRYYTNLKGESVDIDGNPTDEVVTSTVTLTTKVLEGTKFIIMDTFKES